MATRECPLCGGTMQLKVSDVVTYTPGNPKPATKKVQEWVCPDCDNFEEAEEGETG
jgi:YgiT-type zinc finger domain-containing protein